MFLRIRCGFVFDLFLKLKKNRIGGSGINIVLISEYCTHHSTPPVRDVTFFYEEGGVSEDFMGGGDIFSEPKKGGGSRYFPEFNIKYFF